MTFQYNTISPIKKHSLIARFADARVALGILLLAALWGIRFHQISQGKSTQLASAERDAWTVAHLFEENVTRAIESADQALISLRYRCIMSGRKLDGTSELSKGLSANNSDALLTIIDDKADVVLSSQPFQPINPCDREHIQVQKVVTEDRRFIGKPVLDRVS